MHCTVFPAFPMVTYSVFKLKLKYKQTKYEENMIETSSLQNTIAVSALLGTASAVDPSTISYSIHR